MHDRSIFIQFYYTQQAVVTSSSAIAKRPRDASCLSVASFVASIVQYLERSFFTRQSLVREKGEVFVLLYVFFLFYCSANDFSTIPAGRFTPKFACGRTLVPDVSSPLLGVSVPRGGGEKRGN